MLPRGRAVNGWDETGPDPRKPLSFSLIPVTTSLRGTTTVYLHFFAQLFSQYEYLYKHDFVNHMKSSTY